MRVRVRILMGMVLVTALLAPSAPSAADEGDHGGQIVFTRDVYVMNADGSGEVQLTTSEPGSQPDWRPVG